MCEFCTKHGEGRKWYLNANNYSEDLLGDIRRRKFIEKFYTDLESAKKDISNFLFFEKTPFFVQSMANQC